MVELGSKRSPVDSPIGRFSLVFKTMENREEKWKEIRIGGKKRFKLNKLIIYVYSSSFYLFIFII